MEAVIKEHEDYYYYLIERYADLFLENRVINKQFSVVADAQYALGITKFLVNDLGLVPAKQFVVDDTPKNMREQIKEEFKSVVDLSDSFVFWDEKKSSLRRTTPVIRSCSCILVKNSVKIVKISEKSAI